MGVGEVITVVNKSGKVVKSSKHIVNVFKEAQSAYRERKAEIKAERNAAAQEKMLRDGVKAVRLDDDVRSRASSHRSRHSKSGHRSKSHAPAVMERGYTDSFYANDQPPRHRYEDDLAGDGYEGHRRELTRRNTEHNMQYSAPAVRRKSEPYIDMDLAYGDIPPPLPDKKYDDEELREKASKLTMLLDEANCLQHSVTTTIDNLQKNPDALAAVALTLAEISTMVGKMGPGVMLTLKTSFPAVLALLCSPQFMIAGGMAVGVTIVALGGFKIIKKLQAQKEEREGLVMEEPLQLDELEPPELSRIDIWRRGIADIEAESSGTTVDGEFITPGASRQLVAAGVLDEDDLKSRRSSKSHRAKSVHSTKSSKSHKSSKTSRTERTERTEKSSRSRTVREKSHKEPSLVRTLFRSHTMH